MGSWTRSLVFTGLLGAWGLAGAHEPWLRVLPATLEEPGWVSFDFSNSHHLLVPEEDPLKDYFHLEVVGPDGKPLELPPSFFNGQLRVAGEAHLEKPGTYLLHAFSLRTIYDTRLRDGTIFDGAKDEAPAGQGVRTDAFWSSVKAYAVVGTPTSGALGPRGDVFELVPRFEPGSLKAGVEALVLVLFQGKAWAAGECWAERPSGADAELKATTDAEGLARFRLPAAGFWRIGCRNAVESRQDAKADFSTYRAYLSVEVEP